MVARDESTIDNADGLFIEPALVRVDPNHACVQLGHTTARPVGALTMSLQRPSRRTIVCDLKHHRNKAG